MPPGVLTRTLPFSAIKGLEDVKRALECVAVDDDLVGLLIKGPTGTAKSVLVRSFLDVLPDKDIVNVPQNVTEEQLFGGMDVEDAVRHGKRTIKDGLLQRADGNILYLDNINLFDKKILNSIMDSVESGRVIVEREGISTEYECRTTIIATMDPAEQMLSDEVIDRFDICVQTYSIQDVEDRHEIVMMDLESDVDPDGLGERYSEQNDEIIKRILNAKEKLKSVVISPLDISKISRVCIDLKVAGHRGDISVARVAMILAAMDGRDNITDGDIKDAAVLCLLHRRKDSGKDRGVLTTQKNEVPDQEEDEEEEEPVDQVIEEEDPDEENRRVLRTFEPAAVETEEEIGYNAGGIEDLGIVSEITAEVKGRLDDMDAIESVRLHKIAGTGRRSNRTTKKRSGRYRRSKIPDGRSSDPAFDATIRAAAPYQTIRKDRGLSIAIESQDIRDKVRVRRDSCSFLFAVDVSGSLVNSGMMQDIKDGVKAMLMDGYVQRDKVALMTFRSGEVKISVPFTRSVEGICDILDNTTTGGGTPLGPALLMIREYLINYIRKNSEEHCYVVLITDGEATNPVIRGREASIELKKIAAVMNIPNTEWIVVDSSLVPGKINHALNLSRMLNAKYIRLEEMKYI